MSTTTVVSRLATQKGEIVRMRYEDAMGNEFVVPEYTIKDVLDSIPAACFRRSTLRGLSYVARDLSLVAAMAFLATKIAQLPSLPLRIVAWAVYSVCQGLVCTGVWVLAHECGHRAFSPNNMVNDTVGWILHSSMLVPYHSWRISHAKHHKSTGHLDRDMVFVPKTRSVLASKAQMQTAHHEGFVHLVEETPLATAFWLIVQQLWGWPAYLFTNMSGHAYPKSVPWWRLNHFAPSSPLFDKKDRSAILMSDAGLLITASVLYLCAHKFGVQSSMLYYGLPYMWVNHWLVAITYLQHTDPTLPHYAADMWTFPRGATATIDRDFGFIGKHILHGIIETHVAHHFVSRIPFYNAEKATEGIRSVLGTHYRRDTTNLLVALWRSSRRCKFVEDTGSVRFYQPLDGKDYVRVQT